VYQYGTSLIDVLNPQPGERILDLGCGTGELTNAISQRYPGSIVVVGIDADATMIARAQQQYSNLDFRLADARSFALHDEEEPMDAIFSNAALHWVPDADRCIASHRRHWPIVTDDSFWNLEARTMYMKLRRSWNVRVAKIRIHGTFQALVNMQPCLEKHGLEVQSAELYDRPTPLIGDHGLRNWIAMFGGPFLEGVEDKEALFQQAEEELKPKLHNGEHWVADYRRIRITGKKVNASSK
jgi:trans-aconitate 2-methyltransferase